MNQVLLPNGLEWVHSNTKETRLTFMNTPSLFSKVRLNCLHVSNISMLVVLPQEQPRTQTIESTKQINQLGLPIFIVYNKFDCKPLENRRGYCKDRD